MEDNERHLLSHTASTAFDQLSLWADRKLKPLIKKGLAHPVRHQLLLAASDLVTGIVPKLSEHTPSETPFKVLYPGLDLTNFKPLTADPIFRQKITHQSSARLIVYPGGSNLTNAAELRTLYKAVALLNQRGIPVKLVRTGPPTPWFTASLGSDEKQHAFELGFIDRDQIPKLLALADVLVQPGCCGPFNDYRLPSKIPEFLASGRPVILPATNIALSMRDGHEALFLHDGSPEEIANSCVRIFNNPVLATQLGTNGRTFAKTHFDIEKNGKCLESLYQEVLSRPAAANWSILKKKGAEECDLFPLASGRATPHDIRTLAHRRRTAWSHRLRQICTFN
jgi:glycosyltransferase involved in cell wall biosynthesis